MVMVNPTSGTTLLIKPHKHRHLLTTSVEYAMLKSAAMNGWLDEQKTVLETMLSFKRAGTDAILTYYALDIARWLKQHT